MVYRGKAGRCDDVMGWGFQLIGWNHDPAALLSASQREFFARIGGVAFGVGVDEADGVAMDSEGRYRHYFAEHGLQGLLVRPDFTVFGGAGALDELPLLVDQLRDALSGLH